MLRNLGICLMTSVYRQYERKNWLWSLKSKFGFSLKNIIIDIYFLHVVTIDKKERQPCKWFCFLDKQSLYILNKLLYYVIFGQSTWFQKRCNKRLLDSLRCRKNIYPEHIPLVLFMLLFYSQQEYLS